MWAKPMKQHYIEALTYITNYLYIFFVATTSSCGDYFYQFIDVSIQLNMNNKNQLENIKRIQHNLFSNFLDMKQLLLTVNLSRTHIMSIIGYKIRLLLNLIQINISNYTHMYNRGPSCPGRPAYLGTDYNKPVC